MLPSIVLFSAQVAFCQMSEFHHDKKAGVNGGFEYVQGGIPVNWLVYTPKTVSDAKFEIIIDDNDPQEGERSLHFDVQECTSIGGRKSPGIAQEFNVIRGESYVLKFWMKNEGSKFKIECKAVSAKSAEKKDPILIWDQEMLEWNYFEYTAEIPKEFDKLRFELSILSPGKIWIDNFTLTKSN